MSQPLDYAGPDPKAPAQDGIPPNEFFDDMFAALDEVRAEVLVSTKEAADGVIKTITIERKRICETCSGTGSKQDGSLVCAACNGNGQISKRALGGLLRWQFTCRTCKGRGALINDQCDACTGSGFQAKSDSLDVHVPPGTKNGRKLRIAGEGHHRKRDRRAGDLICRVRFH